MTRFVLTIPFVLLLAASPARAGVQVHEASGLRIVTSQHNALLALDPRTHEVVWSRRVREAASVEIVPAADEVWLAVRGGRLEAFDPLTGQVRWDLQVKGRLAWGPRAAAGTLRYVSEAEEGPVVHALDPASGQERWSARVPEEVRHLAVSRVVEWGGDLVLQLRPRPPVPPEFGYRRPPEDLPPPRLEQRTGDLVLVDGKGSVKWHLSTEGKLAGGPWPAGGRLLTEQEIPRGTALYSYDREGKIRWTYPVEERLARPPELLDGWLALATSENLLLVEADRGVLAWQRDLSAAPAEMVVQADQLLLFLSRGEQKTRALVLDRYIGQTYLEEDLEGTLGQVIPADGGVFLFLKTSREEPRLDPLGETVMDLAEKVPKQVEVEGYRLVKVDLEGVRTLAEDGRAAVLGAARLVGGRLVYATRSKPPQEPAREMGVVMRYRILRQLPPLDDPPVLRALDLKEGREAWSFTLPEPDPLKGSWQVVGHRILLATEKDRLVALAPGDGRMLWASTSLGAPPGAVVALEDGTLFGIAGEDFAYGLDPANGRLAWSRNLVPLFNFYKLNNLVGVVLLSLAIGWFIYHARRRELFIRRIAGLNALDEAVGRATEMGKPVLYVTGLADVDDIQTLASLSILGHVARKTAEYDTPIVVPTSRSVVMSTAQEVVKEAYTAAGRPDAFRPENVMYLTDDQFGYTAGIDGIMLRDRPAANFYMGTFYAESLILAETGHSTGAIQIAGTAMAAQLPFFVAACDYTLIGEELYAASAYLSQDPLQTGSLRGQDLGKAIIMACILLGTVLLSFGVDWIKELFRT